MHRDERETETPQIGDHLVRPRIIALEVRWLWSQQITLWLKDLPAEDLLDAKT